MARGGGGGGRLGETASIHRRNTHQFKEKSNKNKKKFTALTWSPPNGSFLAAAETDFAEDPQEMPLAERARVFAGAGATFRSRDPVAVGFPRLAFLPDQGAGDRGHLPEPNLKTESLLRQMSDLTVGNWCVAEIKIRTLILSLGPRVCWVVLFFLTKCHTDHENPSSPGHHCASGSILLWGQ